MATPFNPMPVCPECLTEKHGNCDGTAWDPKTDDITHCTCGHTDYPTTQGA